MKLMVLGRPILSNTPRYRGTYRDEPFHIDELPEDHEANRAFRLYVSVTDEGGPIADMDTAVTILKTYRRFASERDFELIEVVSAAEEAAVGKSFLGFDISCGFYYSLVAAALEMTNNEGSRASLASGVYTLSNLLRRHFHGVLNTHRLFDDRQVAQDCLDAMMALQQIRPNLYENSEMVFEVVGIFKVDVP
jgi:hypothetical protein